MRFLQPCDVTQAIQLLQNGSSVRLVARRFGISQVVSLVLGGGFETLVSNLGELDKGAKRPHHIKRTGISFCLQGDSVEALPVPYKVTCSMALGVNIFYQAVRNRLHSSELRSRRPFVGLILTPHHRAAQMAFAREHQNWQVHHWRPVLFTEESRLNIS